MTSLRFLTRSWMFFCFGLAFLCAAPRARAEGTASNKVAAEALFDRGVSLMKEGKYAEGCAQLEQSNAIERGIGTMLYLAECYERLGRTASAWAMFREAASAARAEGQADRADTGAARAAKLEPKLPKLTLQVAAGNTMPGFAVRLNGVSLPSSTWNVPMPVDPGDNKIDASAPGYLGFSHIEPVTGEGAVVVVSVPVLERDPNAAAAAQASATAPSAVAAAGTTEGAPGLATGSDTGTSDARPWQRPLGLVVGGVGVIGLGIGTYFGLRAISKDGSADDRCPGNSGSCGDARGAQLSKEANDAAKLSNGFLIGGALLAAAGVVLYFTAPASGAPALALGGDGRSVHVRVGGAL